VAGATFAVKSGSTTVATLVVNDAGQAGPSPSLTVGSYKLVETLAPPGYQAGPDRTVTVNANTTTTLTYSGATQNQAIRAQIALAKTDSTTGEALAGAQLGLRYDRFNTGIYDQDLGSCLTAADGTCVVASGELLPGRYEIRELAVPPAYALDPNHDLRQLFISPGEVHTVTFHDPPLISLAIEKVASRDLSIQLAGASIDLYRMDHGTWPAPDAPSDASLLDGGSWIVRIDSATSATVVADLVGGFAYCALEHRPPRKRSPPHTGAGL
ncbi:MAG: SpaA isopeptide-forming pilin-related protein, partial [Actinobacteria bacterium]|nr:SpaA isopeptide-forming pilin-related protein [Actinomycetota bacterium]